MFALQIALERRTCALTPIVKVVSVPSILSSAKYGLDCNFISDLEGSYTKTSFQVYLIQYEYMGHKYILNHYYTLRHDQKRSYIMSQGDGFNKKPFPVNVAGCQGYIRHMQ